MEKKSQLINVVCLMFQSGRTELTYTKTKNAWKRNKHLKNQNSRNSQAQHKWTYKQLKYENVHYC